MIPRFAVVGGVSDFTTFKTRIGYEPLPMTGLSPFPGERAKEVISAEVAEPGAYTGELNFFVSELGRVESSFDRGTGKVTATIDPLKRRINRALISMRVRESGRHPSCRRRNPRRMSVRRRPGRTTRCRRR